MDQNFGRIYYLLGIYYFHTNNLEQSLEELKTSIEHRPKALVYHLQTVIVIGSHLKNQTSHMRKKMHE